MKKSVIAIFLLLSVFKSFSQVQANFIASPTAGCPPMTVTFTNLSTGSGNLTYIWYFGNGNSSNIANPTANYTTPGTYTVTLIVSDGIHYDTLVRPNYIRVYNNPTANFTINPSYGCIPLTINFTNTSTTGDTIITTYIWDFGDGSNSSLQNPTHTYTQESSYSVSLQVIDAHGCQSSYSIPNGIIASDKPHAQFSADYTSSCNAPFTVNFTNQSSGLGSLSYYWNFGDGSSSTAQNPSHTYTQNGNYTVTLTVTNQYGCIDSLSIPNYITISNINADFHIQEGDTVCPNQNVHFINDAGTTALWSFGDGGTSTLTNPTHTYVNPGTYQVIMIAAPGTSCQDTAYRTIVVRPYPNAQFTTSSNFSCGNPITFTPNNTNGTSYSWNFGDNQTSNSTSPSHTYVQNGNYYPSLIITDVYGCQNAYQSPNPIIVEYPQANISASPDKGCKPLPVNFTDNSTCNNNYTHITGWNWDFGNGQTSTQQNPTYTFPDTGTYNVTLTITTDLGCTATANYQIEVGEHQHPQVSINYFEGCANDTIQFTSLSTDSNYIDTYYWSFVNDSNLVIGTSNEANPEIPFNGNGIISLTYIISHNGCFDTLKLDSIFLLHGPYTDHIDTIMVGCHDPYTIGAIMPFIKQANRWYWDMDGDGIYDDSTVFASPVYSSGDTVWYTYPNRGNYNINFIAYNDSSGCFWKEHYNLTIRDINAQLQINSPTCYFNVFMNTANTVDFDSITFIYGDGTTVSLTYMDFLIDSLIYHQYVFHNYPQHSGLYTAYIQVWNNIGCRDTDSVNVRIYHPTPGFTASPLQFCVPYQVTFTDTSSADTTLVAWQYNLVPGSLTSNSQNPTFNITVPGNYTVNFTVTDALGCSASISKNAYLLANIINATINTPDSTLCLGDTAYLISNTPNATTFIWNFGDGSPYDSSQNPYYIYQDTGKYTVTLIVSNPFPGCRDTLIKPNYIQIQDIHAHFNVLDADSNCYPFPVVIFNLTDTAYSPTWYWNFGDGGFSYQHTPSHNYMYPGNYWLTLEATSSFGCKSRDSILISVSGPYTDIIMSDSIICKGDTVYFDVTNSQNIFIYNWDFGDGTTSNGTPTSHTYNYYPANGYFVPSLIYCSDASCCKSSQDTLYVHQVFANFNYIQDNGSSDSVACQHATLIFSNTSSGANTVLWSFGDGSTDTSYNPTQHYFLNTTNATQTYYITLTVESQLGCVDSIKKPFVLYPLPVISLGNDVFICKGSSVQLNAQGGNAIVWQPTEGLNNPSSYTPIASPDSTTIYTATIYDTHGCSNSQSLTVFVQQPPSLSHNNDTTIIIGETVNMWTLSDQNNLTYEWTPSYGLSCTNCPNPIAKPLETTTYTVTIRDSLSCFEITGSITINVKEEYSIDVPSAFTPNGDGINDIVYVRGWGLKQLVEFKIFNRWGQCVFETDDLSVGWDGTYKGVKQDIDTYAYTVKAITYANKELTKNGLINLIR